MNIKRAVTLTILLLVPMLGLAQTPLSYSWNVNSPNVADVAWTNDQIGAFLDSVTASDLTSTVSDFQFSDLDGDGQLELLAGVDFSGRELFNSLAVVRRTSNGFSLQRLEAYDVRTLSGIAGALAGDGKQQLLVPTSLTPYLGGDQPQASWTEIYGWNGSRLADASNQFGAYYISVILPALQQNLNNLLANAPGTIDAAVAQIEYDKVLRISGRDPNAGLAQTLVWAGESDPMYRNFASFVLADIGTPDALTALNRLLTDPDGEVAIYANAAFQGIPDLHFTVVHIDIKPGDGTNPINLKSKGSVPVAILSSPSFNAPASILAASLAFGSTGTENSLDRCDGSGKDVNGDGLLDLVCHFDTQASFQIGDGAGILKGRLKDGTAIKGTDSILIVN